jgi:YidC/Oxa1 family membrane protein insertase
VGFWDTAFINPMINGLIVIEQLLFGNFGLAIILFTVVVRLATLPLTLRQLHAGRKMQTLAPQVQEIQKKYKDPKRRQEETMKLYREAGANPLGCLGPMVIQFPIWLGLYRVLTLTVGGTPERTAELSQRLYGWSFIQNAVPLPTGFLWLDLGRQDGSYVMFALVFVTTWLQTKLSLSQSTAAQTASQQQQNTLMLWMMPIMFAYFTLTVPSGLAMYWVITNVIGIVMNWFVYGWNKRPLRELFASPNAGGAPARRPRPDQAAAITGAADTKSTTKRTSVRRGAMDKRALDGKPGDKRKDGGRGGREGTQATRPRPISGRRRDR